MYENDKWSIMDIAHINDSSDSPTDMDPITFSGIVSFGIKAVLAIGLAKEVVTPLLVAAFGG